MCPRADQWCESRRAISRPGSPRGAAEPWRRRCSRRHATAHAREHVAGRACRQPRPVDFQGDGLESRAGECRGRLRGGQGHAKQAGAGRGRGLGLGIGRDDACVEDSSLAQSRRCRGVARPIAGQMLGVWLASGLPQSAEQVDGLFPVGDRPVRSAELGMGDSGRTSFPST